MLPLILLFTVVVQDADLRKAREYDQHAFESLFDQYYEAGKTYYRSGRRREAVWMLKRSLEIRPNLSNLKRFVNLLQDYDNPVWRKKRWKSPRGSVDRAFQKKQASLDRKYLERMLKVGAHHTKKESLEEHADGWFRKALRAAGGPYEVDRRGCLKLGKAGTIPEDASARLRERDLITINGELWLRDSMLRSLQNVDQVSEARGEHCLVRTVGPTERAAELLAVMEQAYQDFVTHEGLEVERTLGLFVFADQTTYQAYCVEADRAGYQQANGFANNSEGFAVTYEHATVIKTAVHESAHLYHAFAYASHMPSWYDEGFANLFGHEHSTAWDGKELTTGRPPTRGATAELLDDDGLVLPLAALLNGDALAEIQKGKDEAGRFYLQAWALLWFFQSTDDKDLVTRFENWESFCLGSGYDQQSDSAAQLFTRVFGDALPRLEQEFVKWLRELPGE